MAWSLPYLERTIVVDQATLTLVETEHRRKILADVFQPDEYDRAAATAWVVLRRSDQSVTWEAFRGSVTRGAFDAIASVEDDASPEV